MKNADMPANPVKPEIIQGNPQVHLGLTKREAFAMAAMQGLCANSDYLATTELLVKEAVLSADLLLEELEK